MQRFACLVLAAATIAVAHADDAAPRYTKREGEKLMFCTVLIDNAVKISDRKLAGRGIPEVKAEYAAAPFREPKDRDMMVSMVDKVYADGPTDSFEYGLQFIDECLEHVLALPPARTGAARACLRGLLGAVIAWNYRERRRPAEEAQAKLARLGGGSGSLVEAAYSTDAARGEWILARYKGCIAPHVAAQ